MQVSTEDKRQWSHLGLGVGLVALLYYRMIGQWTLLAFVLGSLVFTFLCVYRPNALTSWLLHHLERPPYQTAFPGKGLLFFALGFFLTYLLFPWDVALAALSILTFGDSLPYLVIGRRRQQGAENKELGGVVIGWMGSIISASLFVALYEAALASLVAMVLEFVGIKIREIEWDDNLFIPLAAGGVILLIRVVI